MDPNALIENFRRIVTQHYFDMKGRVGRQEFWHFAFAGFVLVLIALILDSILGSGLLGSILGLALLPPMTGLGARRLQDTARDGSLVWGWAIPCAIIQVIGVLTAISGPVGWLGFIYFFLTIGWLLELLMLIAFVVLIYFWSQPGTSGANRYGAEPRPFPH